MIKILLLLLLTLATTTYADSGSLLNQAGGDIDLNPQIQTAKRLNLDNPFVIQVFSSWKALGPVEMSSNDWVGLILDKEYEKALVQLPNIKEAKLKSIKEASELYLLYQLGLHQTFVKKWVNLSSSSNFLQTELGIALDQIVGVNSTQMILNQGLYLSEDLSEKLKKIEGIPSKLNYSLQALKALRTGENALGWIGKLEESDPLRMPLAQTALLHYAKEGKLGASGKIIKTVIEPILSKSSNEEDVSLYFMTLARLLYQAGALSEAKKYYNLIPETSSYFLKARAESLWAHIKDRDFSRTKGELGTLELKIFNKEFFPEAYLVSAMANVMLCQFNDSRASINRFVEANRNWAKEIDKNLKDPNAKPVSKNFFITNIEKAKDSIIKEKQMITNKNFDTSYIEKMDDEVLAIDNSVKKEIHDQWKNRQTLLETALYKMKFVRIELISRMRQVEMKMKVAGADEVSTQSAAPARRNQLSFKHDGVLWGDDLFHMNASVRNMCIRGELK